MADGQLLKLFDSCWFEHEIFSNKKLCIPSPSTKPTHDQDHHNLEKPKLLNIAVFQVRSLSDRCLRCNTGFSPDVASPKSVLTFTPTLDKLDFVKETSDLSKRVEDRQGKNMEASVRRKVSNRRGRSRRRRSMGMRRSLSDLEYEELKGFMDLGFVFTEEDKKSSLVSILPGLQRWGKKANTDEEEPKSISENFRVSRPYLSEAWGVLHQSKVNKHGINWRFQATCDEIDMKDRLKAWAHTVASSFR